MDRAELISQRKNVLSLLKQEEKQFYFGSLYPGSHEYTEEGYQAAQHNEKRKQELRVELGQLNRSLGLSQDSREEIEI